MATMKRKSVGSLQRRIASGKADPISPHERDQLEAIRRLYAERFGKEPGRRSRTDEVRKRA